MTTCQCGEPFTATTDSRLRHRFIFGHTPTAELPVVEPDRCKAEKCRRGNHSLCGGGLLHKGQPTECDCSCHGGAA